MQSHSIHQTQVPVRADLHPVKIDRPTRTDDRPMGFSRHELRRLVADMIG